MERVLSAGRSPSAAPDVLDFSGAAALLNDREFATVRELIAQYAGIKLSLQKRNMVYNRLLRRLRARNVASFSDYLELVVRDDGDEREAFVNALTTNLTAFF
ncbi:MAG TPA: chemotaxis protein CheR, partial [Ramlibacter sp.]|nr:chemotaxis protein CheR [Ramlibacter sp.]